MKRILILNYEFPPLGGGASPVSHSIAKGYVERGHAVDVVTMGFRGLPKEETIDGIHVFRVPSLRAREELCRIHEMFTYLLSATFFLLRRMHKVKYDICHSHFIIPTSPIALMLKWVYGLRYVITLHGSDVPGFNEDRFTLSHMFTKSFLQLICNHADKVVSPSKYLKDLVKKNICAYPDAKLVVIPNGIDPSGFVPLPKKNIILSTGRLLPRKGFQYLIKAVLGKDIGYEVHIAGDGPERTRLEELARESKTKIVFHGWLDNTSEEFRQLIGTAAIYCLLSAKENASIALLEGMSAGCAVITTNVSGCSETVGEAGLLVNPGDVADVQKALLRLVDNTENLHKYQQAARERVIRDFDWEYIVDKYMEILL